MNIKYFLGSLISIPLLPILYFQGKSIRAKIPKLPEAENPEGKVIVSSDRTIKLLCIGESTIAGVGVKTHEEGFTGSLAQALSTQLKLNVHWKVVAKSGYTAKEVKQKLVPKILEESPDLLVVGLGGNDAFQLNSPGKWRKHIQALIDSIRNQFKTTPIVFTNMPPIKEFPAFTPLIKFTIGNLVELLGEELEKILPQEKVYFNANKITFKDWIDKLPGDLGPTDFFSDGVHPSKLTYQIWAKDFADYIIHSEKIRHDLQIDIDLK